jgi:murein DD-endopeptidase MepM/ murein hydrolase activator NlpD
VKALFIFIVLLALAQAQDNVQDLEQQIRSYETLLETRKQEIAANEAALGETATALEARVADRDQIANELSSLNAERNQLLEETATLKTSMAEIAQHMVDLQDELEALKMRVSQLLVELYQQRGGRLAQVLGQAASFHDLQVKTYYLSLLSERDLSLIEDLNTATDVLAGLQQEQAQQLTELHQKNQALEATTIQLEAKRAELRTVIGELESSQAGQLAVRTALLKEQEGIEASIQQAIRTLAAEQERLRQEAEAKRRQAEAATSASEQAELDNEAEALEARSAALGAALPPPAAGYIYPILNPTLLNSFEDGSFLALRTEEVGAAVHAVQSGVVLSVQNMGANMGYMVLLKHPENISMAYVNLQAVPNVAQGDPVQQGDLLGYLGGSTLTPPNVLKVYALKGEDFIDPAEILGF